MKDFYDCTQEAKKCYSYKNASCRGRLKLPHEPVFVLGRVEISFDREEQRCQDRARFDRLVCILDYVAIKQLIIGDETELRAEERNVADAFCGDIEYREETTNHVEKREHADEIEDAISFEIFNLVVLIREHPNDHAVEQKPG